METIPINQLKDGDVLLYHSIGLISDLIRAFDGSEYSHSAIHFEGSVLESDRHGINKKDVLTSVEHARYVDVYRFKSDNGDEIGVPDFPFAGVKDVILEYEIKGGRYEYESAVLLAVLASIRRAEVPLVSWFLRSILENALELVNQIKNAGREPMICSELVYRCYNEALPNCKYRLLISGADSPQKFNEIAPVNQLELSDAPVESTVSEINELKQEFKNAYSNAKSANKANPGLELAQNLCGLAVASYVTPHDLARSPNLYKAGRLKK